MPMSSERPWLSQTLSGYGKKICIVPHSHWMYMKTSGTTKDVWPCLTLKFWRWSHQKNNDIFGSFFLFFFSQLLQTRNFDLLWCSTEPWPQKFVNAGDPTRRYLSELKFYDKLRALAEVRNWHFHTSSTPLHSPTPEIRMKSRRS